MRVNAVQKYSLFEHPRKPFARQSSCPKIENAIPPEFKWAHNQVTLIDINQVNKDQTKEDDLKTDEAKKKLNELINKTTIGEISSEVFLKILTSSGYTPSESHSILAQSLYHTTRACDWAHENETQSGKAANCILFSTTFGILKIVFNHLKNNSLLKNALGILENSFSALRGYKQFKIYGERPDDDRAENLYEAERYGNKASGLFADLAYFFETKFNPLILPILSFTQERFQNAIKPLLSLCNILWWRVRMPQEINQRFATDFLNFLIHKPLSLFGIKKSKKVLNEIDRENLTYKYINKRARDLIGLDPKKDKSVSTLSKLGTEIKSLFIGNINEKIKSSIRINKFISPFLGLYGFFTASIGIPLKSIFNLFNKESKFLNIFSQSCFASQQIIYFFRLMLPEYLENKKITVDTKNPRLTKLVIDKNRLSYFAVTICGMNIISVFLKLVNFKNKYLNLGMEIYDEIADNGIPYYLSKRRALLGTKFKLDNPELFNNNGTPKLLMNEKVETKHLQPIIAIY